MSEAAKLEQLKEDMIRFREYTLAVQKADGGVKLSNQHYAQMCDQGRSLYHHFVSTIGVDPDVALLNSVQCYLSKGDQATRGIRPRLGPEHIPLTDLRATWAGM